MREQFINTFRGKKVFITGHTGFKGAWLTLWMQLLGAKVMGFSLSPEDVSMFSMLGKKLKCTNIFEDIRRSKKLKSAVLNFQPDFIFHLAAQSLVRYSYKFPLSTFNTNVLGTANLLNALRKLNKKCVIIIVTTDKVYENKEKKIPFKENDRLSGYDPYSASKVCAEFVTDSFIKSFFPVEKHSIHKKYISIVRAGNVIGGGDFSKDRLLPDIIKAVQQNNTIIIRNPDSVRPWQYILEPLSGYMRLASLMSNNAIYSGSYNFGPNKEDSIRVEDVVKLVIKNLGKGKYTKVQSSQNPHEAAYLELDITKAKTILKWKPKINISEAIQRTIMWHKIAEKNLNHIFEYSKNEIQYFNSRK